MLRVLHLIAIFTNTIAIERSNSGEVFNSNDWIPITRDKVFSGLNREFVLRDHYAQTLNQNLNDLAVSGNVYNNEEILVNEPQHTGYKTNWNPKRSFMENMRTGAGSNKKNTFLIETLSDDSTQRKAKVLTNKYINDINNLAAANILEKNYKLNEATDKYDHTATKRYEVTESNEMQLAGEGNHIIDAKNTSLRFSESNKIFKVNADDGNDLTKKFLSILSSYNIRVNDALPNYELSRSERSPSKHDYILIPVPVRFLNRYKVAAAPLLALMLSNYGYSLKRQEGFYNNQFTGLYKTYPDTDSSQ